MFIDRKDGGIKLGKALEKYKDKDVVVLGIPRGGVETAYYVARHLNAELSLVIAKKLGHPYNPELAIGAITEDGSVFMNDFARDYVTDEIIEAAKEEKKREIQRRVQKLRQGEPLPDLKGRTVIIVDDGIATGATIFASIKLCKNKGAKKIVVAAPVGGPDSEQEIGSQVDEVVILEKPAFYHAVSQGYQVFFNLSDEEAMDFMEKWKYEVHEKHK